MIAKTCRRCDVEKPGADFHKDASKRDGLSSYCKPCGILYSTEWVAANRERHNANTRKSRLKYADKNRQRGRDYHRRLREEVLAVYGNACACCGETHFEFLAIDHINGGGAEQRRKNGRGNSFYNWLKNNDYPEGFRVLCHNCNMALGLWHKCPHEGE